MASRRVAASARPHCEFSSRSKCLPSRSRPPPLYPVFYPVSRFDRFPPQLQKKGEESVTMRHVLIFTHVLTVYNRDSYATFVRRWIVKVNQVSRSNNLEILESLLTRFGFVSDLVETR